MAQADDGLILTPLDGSEMSEFAVPYAATVAEAIGGSVLVARIVERMRWSAASSGYMMSPSAYAELLELDQRDAETQTQRVVNQLNTRGVAARNLVEIADMRGDLVNIQAREHVALVVMATHARSGIARAALGSVADHLVRQGHCPTLVVRARGRRAERPALTRALIPLDGSAMSELAFAALAPLAGRLITEVTLVRVIAPDDRSGASLDAQRALDVAKERIERECERLHGHIETLLLWGPVASQILDESEHHGLIIMTTHGQTGVSRWTFGSVADEIVREARTPVLLSRPQRQP
jgi:nucleotide-binding universal stress UspA family protein